MAKVSTPTELTVEMKLTKSTKNTHVYATDEDKAVCSQVYINKVGLPVPEPAPKTITLIVKVK